MSRVVRAAATSAALLLGAMSATYAHHPDVAAGGNAGIITIGATPLEEGHFGFAVLAQFAGFTKVNFGALQPGEDTHQIKSLFSPSFTAAYGIASDIMIAVRLPWVRRNGIVDGHIHTGGVNPHVEALGDSSGIGDLTALGQWRFLNRSDWGLELAALLGIKLPTGRTGERDRNGGKFEAEFQPGSGSVDGLFGLAATRNFGAWSLHANVLYILAGTGTQHTDLGDRFLYNLAATWRFYGGPNEHGVVSGTFALDAVLELNGEWQERQSVSGERDPNSGGNVIYLSPGLRATWRGTAASVSFGVPMVRDLNGLQSKPKWRLISGISTSF